MFWADDKAYFGRGVRYVRYDRYDIAAGRQLRRRAVELVTSVVVPSDDGDQAFEDVSKVTGNDPQRNVVGWVDLDQLGLD